MNNKVYEAIYKVAAALGKNGIAKDRQGLNYKFRGIDDIYNALSSELAANKLCILPYLLERESVERTSNKGGALFYITVKARFDIVSAEDGSKHEVVTYGEAMDSSDKATNKAMSAAYKYMAFMTFCIPTEGDNDSENATHEVVSKTTELQHRITQFTEALNKCSTRAAVASLVSKNGKLLLWIKEQSQIEYENLMKEIEKHNEAFQLAGQ